MKIKVLFENNWRAALKKCTWLDAHHLYFDDVEKIISYCHEHQIQIIFGNNYRAQNFLELNQACLRQANLQFLVNSRYVLDHFVDKRKFDLFMREQGFADYVPRNYETVCDIEYPCIIKPKSGGVGKGVRIAFDEADLGDIDTNKYLVSEFLEGDEYASSIFYHRGEIISHFSYVKSVQQSHYVLQQVDKRDLHEAACPTAFLELFLAILQAANPSQETCQCSINFKIINGIPKIFEINCRIGYTLAGYPDDFKVFFDHYLAALHETQSASENDNFFSLAELAEITKGRWENLHADFQINQVEYIYKYLQAGDLYVVRHEGWPKSVGYTPNEHLAPKVLNKPVAALMVNETFAQVLKKPMLRVENTYRALEMLASRTSQTSKARRILIVGSYGKTGLKNSLYHILHDKLAIHARLTSANYSASTYCSLASLKKSHQLYIVELPIANKTKMLKRAALIAPDICVLTGIGHDHIERFKTIDRIIEHKVSVAQGLAPGGKFIIPRESLYLDQILHHLQNYPHIEILSFGYQADCAAQILFQQYRNFGWDVIARISTQLLCYRLPFPETHAPLSSLPVLLTAYLLGFELTELVEQLGECENFKSSGRLQRFDYQGKQFYLYDQSYRGGIESYQSFFETLAYFKPQGKGKKIVLSSEFVDCKDNEQALIDHTLFQNLIRQAKIDEFYSVENFCEHLQVLPDKHFWKNHAKDFDTLKDQIVNNLEQDDILCIKGIFESQLPKFVAYLHALPGLTQLNYRTGLPNRYRALADLTHITYAQIEGLLNGRLDSNRIKALYLNTSTADALAGQWLIGDCQEVCCLFLLRLKPLLHLEFVDCSSAELSGGTLHYIEQKLMLFNHLNEE